MGKAQDQAAMVRKINQQVRRTIAHALALADQRAVVAGDPEGLAGRIADELVARPTETLARLQKWIPEEQGRAMVSNVTLHLEAVKEVGSTVPANAGAVLPAPPCTAATASDTGETEVASVEAHGHEDDGLN